MDFIEIYDENDNKKKMEVVCTFRLKGYNYNYMIYKEIDNSHYYLGKYSDDNFNLSTDFDENELKEANKVFTEVNK